MEAEKIKKPLTLKSKYELTLSEFPLFLLSTKTKTEDVGCIEYKDTIKGKGGVEVVRKWKVVPDGGLGFGTASTFSTFFELLQIWKDQGFYDQLIRFESIYNIIKRKGLPIGSTQYKQIVKDLKCLVGIRIEAENAFWDNDVKAYVDMTFHLFDTLYLYKEKHTGQAVLPLASIKVSDVLLGSVQKNSLLTANFDSAFFHNLTPIEQRLALYLSKVFRSQSTNKRELLEFARQIPIHAKQTIHIRESIRKACNGLITKGFNQLESFEFEKQNIVKKEFIIFKRAGKPSRHPVGQTSWSKFGTPSSQKESSEIGLLVEDILAVCQDEKSKDFYKKVAGLMPSETIYQVISEVKEIRDLGDIKKSKGALFTNIIKKHAKGIGVDL